MLVVATAAGAHAALPSSTVQALHDLWSQTGGPNWNDECFIGSTWSDTDPCEPASNWTITGTVVCDTSGSTVTGLDLSVCNLIGSIPDTIGNLTNLTHLVLSSNNLSGSIPDTIGNLTNLQQLGLYSNHLSGSIGCGLVVWDQIWCGRRKQAQV